MALDYDDLVDRPRINGHVLTGDMSSEDLGIEGGSGNIADVLVNGQSVVDEFHNANIKSYKEVTQAQYNALPASKTEDGVMYCITDAHGADGYPPLIYSDEEREVGVWRDGRPLYQKTLKIVPNSPLEPDTSVQLSFSSSFPTGTRLISVDSVLGYYNGGSSTLSNCKRFSEERNYSSSFDGLSVYYEPTLTSIYVRTGSNYGNFPSVDVDNRMKEFYVTYRYIKMTDVVGSGTWTTQGGYAHHYSTDEHVVGTWIDGKPLYEKTISKAYNELTDYGVRKGFGIDISNTDIKEISAVANSSVYGRCFLGCRNYTANTSDSSYWAVNMYYSLVVVEVYNNNFDTISPSLTATFRYTKTTD